MVEIRYQTVLRRIGASIIDGIIFLPIGFISEYFIDQPGTLIYQISSITQTLLFAAYMIIAHAKYGHTIGKKMFGLQVLNYTETGNISYMMAFLRDSVWVSIELGIAIYAFTQPGGLTTEVVNFSLEDISIWILYGWYILEFIVVLLNRKHRAIHDFMAGSVVVKRSEFKRAPLTREPGDLLDPVPE
ncbi:MAG: RDD family protein [Ferruginibacter sp.]